MGQGLQTRCAQVAAHVLGIPLDTIAVRAASTEVSANAAPSGGTVSSHVAMRLIQKAGQKLLKRLQKYKNKGDDATDSCKKLSS